MRPTTEAISKRIDASIEQCFQPVPRPENPRKLVVAYSQAKDYYGIVSAASLSFSGQLDRGRQAVWIDLDEVTGADELFEVLLHTIARKAGVVDWMPVLAQSGVNDLGMNKLELAQARQQELARLTHNPEREWVIYLNARSGGAGANFVSVDSYDEKFAESGPNGWLDRSAVSPMTGSQHPATDSSAEFIRLIDGFCREACPNIALVLLCYERPSAEHSVLNALDGDYWSIPVTESCLEATNSTQMVSDNAKLWITEGGVREESARRRFLFACASVNRVRSPALLWSWAFHGGSSGQVKTTLGSRKENTRKWLIDLQELHVVRIQAGGFVWMQSDVRRGLRGAIRNVYGLDSSIIPRVHQGIAEWYGRLHVSSRSPRAATEVAYHQCIRARFLLEGLPAEFNEKKSSEVTHQVLQALGAALRILRQGRPSMLSDGFTQGTCRRLEDLRDKQCAEKIRAGVLDEPKEATEKRVGKRALLDKPGDDTPNADKIDYALDQLIALTFSLNLEIAQEIGNHGLAFQRWKEFGTSSGFYKEEPIREYLRLLNCWASLGIAVRSTVFANKVLARAFKKVNYTLIGVMTKEYLTKPSKDGLSDRIRELTHTWLNNEAINRLGKPQSGAAMEDVKLQLATGVVKSLQRQMQTSLCEAFYAQVWNGRRGDSQPGDSQPGDSPQRVKERGSLAQTQATLCYELAIELKRGVHRDGLRYQEARANHDGAHRMVSRDNISGWFDDQQRLDTQHAICLAMDGDFDKAFRRLNEAEGALIELHGSHGLEQAIIDLHRAAIFQWQATTSTSEWREDILKAFRDTICNDPDTFWDSSVEIFKAATPPTQSNSNLRSHIEDSWQALDRAGPVLERFRKNAWWTTWYFELRTKLIEYELFASIAEHPGDSLPYVGTEAVPCTVPTMLDGLLDNARRMIRMDVYRLARIVESYSNCLLVLGVWRCGVLRKSRSTMQGTTERSVPAVLLQARELHAREVSMLQWLANERPRVGRDTAVIGARLKLKKLLNARTQLSDGTKLSPDVKHYVESVIAHSERVITFSKVNIERLRAIRVPGPESQTA